MTSSLNLRVKNSKYGFKKYIYIYIYIYINFNYILIEIIFYLKIY